MGIGIGIYAENSREAVELYCRAFGLDLGYHVLRDDGNYFHSELMKNGEAFLAVAYASEADLSCEKKRDYINPVEMGYTVESKEEFEHIYAILKEEGNVIMDICELPWSPMAATIIDKFGVRWYITLPQYQPEDDTYLSK